MQAADPSQPAAPLTDRPAVTTALVTAAALAIPPFFIGVQAGGVAAGTIQALIVLIATAVFGRAIYRGTMPRPFNASLGVLLLALLAALTAVSISWSVLPNASYLDAVRLISYTALLALAAYAAQKLAARSREVLLGLGLAALIISLWALLSHVVPSWFPEGDDFARLRLPFGYWNAVGSVAAMGLIAALWAGTSRRVARWLEVISYPSGGVFVAVVMLSYSRGALLALGVAFALWLLISPLRLRSVGWLAVVWFLSAVLVAWAYNKTALSIDHAPLADRKSAGLELGVFLVVILALLGGAGFAMSGLRRTRTLSPAARYAAGRGLLIGAAVVAVLLVIGASVAGDDGVKTIPNAVTDSFSQSATVPGNTPDRLTQTSSLRGRYWSDAFKVFGDHTLHGAGGDTFSASRLPYRHDTIVVTHAHGQVPQTAADLGIWGLLVLAALTLVWLVAAFKLVGGRKAAPYRWLGAADETRLAGVAMVLVALVFGIHNAVDWIWYVPGVAFFGLFAGGWVLGHPDAHSAVEATSAAATPNRTLSIAKAAAVAVIGLWIAFAVYQPVRAEHKINEGIDVAEKDPAKALKLGEEARDIDPTSADAAFLVAVAQSNGGREKAADETLVMIANEQPANPATWRRLAQYRLITLNHPASAIAALRPLLYQSPTDVQGNAMLEQARKERTDQLIEEAAEKQRKKLQKELERIEKILKSAPAGTNAAAGL